MDLRIERQEAGDGVVVLFVSGWIRADYMDTLSEVLAREDGKVALDLGEVILVDRTAVRFLCSCQAAGIELRNCPAFVREWIVGEAACSQS
jgi:anti-anti-sigma regulatory factor